jgi:hypothetical protein
MFPPYYLICGNVNKPQLNRKKKTLVRAVLPSVAKQIQKSSLAVVVETV